MRSILLVVVVVASWQVASGGDTKGTQTFYGEISDSSCAMNVHSLSASHAEMLKKQTTGSDAASCARYCVKNLGASFVLVTKKDVYRLTSDEAAEPYSGHKVVVHGTLDKKTQTIQVETIQPVGAKAKP